MAQRLSKKPISEGFDLMDRGYGLGAMRLFIFKAETSPPFQLGPCLDAIGHLLAAMEEGADAKENFGYAAEKYELIQQPVLAHLMKVRGIEATEGPAAALQSLDAFLQETDAGRQAHTLDAKTKSGLARGYYIRADLAFKVDPEANAAQALADAEYAASMGWDRVHLAHYLIGIIKLAVGDAAGGQQALEQCIATNANYFAAYEALIPSVKQSDRDKALQLMDAAIALHPRSALLREKAFTISECGNDVEALAFLEALIADPPHEETESLSFGGTTAATLLKAKAAILADGGNMEQALAAAEQATQASPGDEEAENIIADIKAAMAGQ